MEIKKSNFFIRIFKKVRKKDPINLFDLINFWIFPFLAIINFLIVSILFSSELQYYSYEINSFLFNKLLVFTIIFFLWGVFPLLSLIKQPYSLSKANTFFFGSLLYYTILLNNILLFYIGFFILMSRNTTFGLKIKYKISTNTIFIYYFNKIFKEIKVI